MASRPHDGGQQVDDAARRERTAEVAAPEVGLVEEHAPGSSASLQHALARPDQASSRSILSLGWAAGNRAVSRYIQARLIVGAASDRYEQEADRVADRVLRMPAPVAQGPAGAMGAVQRQAEEEEEIQAKPLAASIAPLVQRQAEDEEEVQAKRAPHDLSGSFEAGRHVESRLAANRGGGSPLPAEVRAYMEPRFGADFGGVRLHTGDEATQLNEALQSRAFTHGSDIYLRRADDDVATPSGRWLLVHELAHVVQQGAAPVPSVQSRRAQAGDQPVPIAEARAAERGLLQRVVVPYKQVHRDWNLAERHATFHFELGFSPPWVNGTLCTSALATQNALVKPQITVTPKGKDQYEAEVYSAPVNIAGSEMWLPTPGPWRHAGADKRMIASYAGVQPTKPGGTIDLEVAGVPDHRALARQIEAHENVHASDNKRIIDQVLGQWDAKIHKAQAEKLKFTGGTADEAKEGVFRYIGGTAENIGTRLDQQWGQASDDYHKTAEGKTLDEKSKLDEKRNRLTLIFRLTAKV